MKKKDLKTGMVARFNDDTTGLILLGTKRGDIVERYIGCNYIWIHIKNLKDDLSDPKTCIKEIFDAPEGDKASGIGAIGKSIWRRRDFKKGDWVRGKILSGIFYVDSILNDLLFIDGAHYPKDNFVLATPHEIKDHLVKEYCDKKPNAKWLFITYDIQKDALAADNQMVYEKGKWIKEVPVIGEYKLQKVVTTSRIEYKFGCFTFTKNSAKHLLQQMNVWDMKSSEIKEHKVTKEFVEQVLNYIENDN